MFTQPVLAENIAFTPTANAWPLVTGYLSQRVSDGSQISLFVQDSGGGYYMVDKVTESTVALLQNALADPTQSVEFYRVNDKVGLIFRKATV